MTGRAIGDEQTEGRAAGVRPWTVRTPVGTSVELDDPDRVDHLDEVDPAVEAVVTDKAPPVASATVVSVDDDEPDDRPRAVGQRTTDDIASYLGAAVASLALVWLVFEDLLAWSGTLGFIVCWWFAFMIVYAFVTSLSHPGPVVVDRVVGAVVMSGAALVGLALLATVLFILKRGWPALHHMNFYTQDMAGVRPTAPLTQGGVLHAIVGTLLEVAIAVAISMPLGIGTAVYMTEVGGRLSRLVRTVVEAMTALPDILAGLFVYAVLIKGLHWERTGMTAALALVVTIVPIVARSAEVTLRVVPGGLREASLALGATQWRTVWQVVLPTARAGLVTALILGIARIAGETAPLLIVSSQSTFFNANPTNGPMNSLPLFIISSVRSGQPLFIQRGYGAAALLLLIVMFLFVAARFAARDRVKR